MRTLAANGMPGESLKLSSTLKLSLFSLPRLLSDSAITVYENRGFPEHAPVFLLSSLSSGRNERTKENFVTMFQLGGLKMTDR